jgi:hypothetical protein
VVRAPARNAVDGRRERTGQLGEGGRAVGSDVEHAVVQLDGGIVDADPRRRRPPHHVTAGGQGDPALTRRPDPDGDRHAITRRRRPVRRRRGRCRRRRSHSHGGADPQAGGDQPLVRCHGSPVDRQRYRGRQVERPREIGHRVGRGVWVDDHARTVGPGRFARRDRREFHAGTVGAHRPDPERPCPR